MGTFTMPTASGGMPPQPAFPSSTPRGMSQERTIDSPKPQNDPDPTNLKGAQHNIAPETPPDVQAALIDIMNRYTEQWLITRRRRIRMITKAREYLQGNQYISFDPHAFLYYDPLETLFEGDEEQEDLGIYRYVTNFYQMLCLSFIASLSSQVPKTQFMPANAEKEEDIATAEAASTLQAIIERKNKIRAMLRQMLLYFWTDGIYFRYTRFVVDKSRWKTHKEPVRAMQQVQVLPDRFTCPDCDHDTPASAANANAGPGLNANCQNCGNKLTASNYYPGESMEIPVVTGFKDVPNGMVTQTVYGLLNVTVAPYADEVRLTEMLKLDEETSVGAVRSAYPEAWTEAASESASTGGEQESERLARQLVINAAGGRNNLTSSVLPTLSRTWIQDFGFAILDDQNMVNKLRQMYPDGVMMVHLGQKFLEARPEKLVDHWTMAKAFPMQGMSCPGVGEAALDLQDQVNDTGNSTQEHLDRNASPETYVNESVISSKALAGRPTLPGTIVGIKIGAEQANRPISDFMFQRKVQIDAAMYERPMKLFEMMQLITGVMPQTFGGEQSDIQTLGGQQQALNVALGRLAMFWESIRDEHAEASEIGVRCGAENFIDDVMDVVGGGDKDFRNRYVRLEDLQGEFHAYPEEDQGIPQTYAEIRDRLTQLFLAPDNPWAAELMEDPVNQKMVATYLGPPGMVIPGDAARRKTMRTINQLLEQKPRQQMQQLPNGQAAPILIPSILPDPDFEDYDTDIKIIERWAQENYTLAQMNPMGFENVRAYYKLCKMGQMQKAAQDLQQQQMMAAMTGGGAPGGPGGQPSGQPGGPAQRKMQ